MSKTLDDYTREIEAVRAAFNALPPDHDIEMDDPHPCDFETEEEWSAEPPPPYRGAVALMNDCDCISVSIRRTLWNNRNAARNIADKADQLGREIGEKFDLWYTSSPRFPASYSSCSGWSKEVR